MEGIQTFKGSWPWPCEDLGSGRTAYHRASLIDLYLYTKFHWNRRNFLWTDGRTYGRTDIFPPLILLGRLLEVDLKTIFKHELRVVLFTWPNLCSLDLSVFILLVGRNFVSGICKLKTKKKPKNRGGRACMCRWSGATSRQQQLLRDHVDHHVVAAHHIHAPNLTRRLSSGTLIMRRLQLRFDLDLTDVWLSIKGRWVQ